ncbi:ATP-binding protein [Streptomyces sp. NBC_00237]|uniref:ATP-binding protein n=1 Tax=Streptomyces sp. NBC_00237 TaxID=2975687 RepID=UPI0022511AFB|nr:ATP-binding protein [Streptomyces sp. NBC_00237]MCX5200552.1 ATP-binding protein [Streptomyces sp. NBC_00237]
MRNRNRPALTADVSLVFPPDPAWVRNARETVRTLVEAAGRGELLDAAVLLTSEVVTNSIAACTLSGTAGPITLFAGWTDLGKLLRVLVHDEAPGRPQCQSPAPDSEGGRGMQLVSGGADAWGVCAHGPGEGKATWFELGRFERGYRFEGWLP